jgi:hypothetical protein
MPYIGRTYRPNCERNEKMDLKKIVNETNFRDKESALHHLEAMLAEQEKAIGDLAEMAHRLKTGNTVYADSLEALANGIGKEYIYMGRTFVYAAIIQKDLGKDRFPEGSINRVFNPVLELV